MIVSCWEHSEWKKPAYTPQATFTFGTPFCQKKPEPEAQDHTLTQLFPRELASVGGGPLGAVWAWLVDLQGPNMHLARKRFQHGASV